MVVIMQDLKFELNLFMDSEDIGCARNLFPCMHAHEKCFPNRSYCVCLVVTKQDLKYELNPFMDSRDIGCAR